MALPVVSSTALLPLSQTVPFVESLEEEDSSWRLGVLSPSKRARLAQEVPASPDRTGDRANPSTPDRPLASKVSFTSPEQLKSPMPYHDADKILQVKNRELRGFKGKVRHSIAPPSAEKQARVAQRHYKEIRMARKFQLGSSPSKMEKVEIAVEEDGATIDVLRTGFRVKQDGRDREFGEHETVTKHKERQVRMYPRGGTGIYTLSGSDVLMLIAEHRRKPTSPSFHAAVAARVKASKGDSMEAESSDDSGAKDLDK